MSAGGAVSVNGTTFRYNRAVCGVGQAQGGGVFGNGAIVISGSLFDSNAVLASGSDKSGTLLVLIYFYSFALSRVNNDCRKRIWRCMCIGRLYFR